MFCTKVYEYMYVIDMYVCHYCKIQIARYINQLTVGEWVIAGIICNINLRIILKWCPVIK